MKTKNVNDIRTIKRCIWSIKESELILFIYNFVQQTKTNLVDRIYRKIYTEEFSERVLSLEREFIPFHGKLEKWRKLGHFPSTWSHAHIPYPRNLLRRFGNDLRPEGNGHFSKHTGLWEFGKQVIFLLQTISPFKSYFTFSLTLFHPFHVLSFAPDGPPGEFILKVFQ